MACTEASDLDLLDKLPLELCKRCVYALLHDKDWRNLKATNRAHWHLWRSTKSSFGRLVLCDHAHRQYASKDGQCHPLRAAMPRLESISCLDFGGSTAQPFPTGPQRGNATQQASAGVSSPTSQGLAASQRLELLKGLGIFLKQSVLELAHIHASNAIEGQALKQMFPSLQNLSLRLPQDSSFLQLLQGMLSQPITPALKKPAVCSAGIQGHAPHGIASGLHMLHVDCLPPVR